MAARALNRNPLAAAARALRRLIYRARLVQLDALCDNLETARHDVRAEHHHALRVRSDHIKRGILEGLA